VTIYLSYKCFYCYITTLSSVEGSCRRQHYCIAWCASLPLSFHLYKIILLTESEKGAKINLTLLVLNYFFYFVPSAEHVYIQAFAA